MKFQALLLIFILAIAGGFFGSFLFENLKSGLSGEDMIKEFYEIENAVHVSPHSIRKAIDKGDDSFVLVDLRSPQEYAKEHIKGAVNIPAYKDPDTSAYGDVDRIVNSFKDLQANNPDKDVIVYCYSTPCMTGRKIGLMLAENDIFVKHLGIGWNEWRYSWNQWNHEHEWNSTDVMDYIESTPMSVAETVSGCSADGEFGC